MNPLFLILVAYCYNSDALKCQSCPGYIKTDYGFYCDPKDLQMDGIIGDFCINIQGVGGEDDHFNLRMAGSTEFVLSLLEKELDGENATFCGGCIDNGFAKICACSYGDNCNRNTVNDMESIIGAYDCKEGSQGSFSNSDAIDEAEEHLSRLNMVLSVHKQYPDFFYCHEQQPYKSGAFGVGILACDAANIKSAVGVVHG